MNLFITIVLYVVLYLLYSIFCEFIFCTHFCLTVHHDTMDAFSPLEDLFWSLDLGRINVELNLGYEMITFELFGWIALPGKNFPKSLKVAFRQYTVMFIFMARRFKWLSFHNHLKEYIATGKQINLVSMIDSLRWLIQDLGSIILNGANGLGRIEINFIMLVINKIARASEIS